MSKRKMRAFAMAMATALAFVPFLGGCTSANDGEGDANGNGNGNAQQELSYDEQQRNEAEGSIGEGVQYGQVMAVNGNEATVVLGDLGEASDGSGSQTFSSGQDEITFDTTGVKIVDETGAEVQNPTLSADDVIVMRGTGTGKDFVPTTVEVLDIAGAGTNADDAGVPQAAE